MWSGVTWSGPNSVWLVFFSAEVNGEKRQCERHSKKMGMVLDIYLWVRGQLGPPSEFKDSQNYKILYQRERGVGGHVIKIKRWWVGASQVAQSLVWSLNAIDLGERAAFLFSTTQPTRDERGDGLSRTVSQRPQLWPQQANMTSNM